MDPNACLIRLLDAVESADRDDLISACEDLAEWLDREGFLPSAETIGKWVESQIS